MIVPLDDMGRVDVYVARSADVIIDTDGYFEATDAGTNTFYVPGGGTPAKNGAALAAAVVELNALSGGVRAALELGPGVFDLGTTGIVIHQAAVIAGAGQTVTTIIGGDTYAEGSGGTFDMTHTFVDAATMTFAGTATCGASSGPGTFMATGCP